MSPRKRRRVPGEATPPDRKRLSLTSEEVEGVACGYWDVLERMIDATDASAPSGPADPTRRRDR